ncbi:ERAP1-like C-terminal domain-containing protein, partial [Amphritea spongicola]
LVLLNDDDLTFIKLRLDEQSLRTVVESAGEIVESLPRALVFAAAWDMTRDGEMPARDYVRLVSRNLAGVRDVAVAQTLQRQAVSALIHYVSPEWQE